MRSAGGGAAMTADDEGSDGAAAPAGRPSRPKHKGPDSPARSPHPQAKSVGWALMHAARLHRARVGERLAELGLFAGQEQVIQALADGPMTMGELAATLRVRPPTASKTVARLGALGVLTRAVEDGDGRLVRVGLTPAGREKAAAIEGIWAVVEDELLDGLDRKARRRLRRGLRRAARNLAGAAPALAPPEPA